MNNMIEIRERGERLHVEIPYELKDSLKKAFRSAKWHSEDRTWSVVSSGKKRLALWIKKVEESGVLETLQDRSHLELTARELEELHGELDVLKQRLAVSEKERKENRAKKERIATIKAQMNAIKKTLDDAARSVARERDELAAERAMIEARVAEVIDLGEMKEAVKTMLQVGRTATQIGRARFKASQEVIDKVIDQLNAAGLDSKQLWILVNANYNRGHKDYHAWQAPVEFEVLETRA